MEEMSTVATLSSPTGGAPVKGSRREPAERVRLGEGMLVAGLAPSCGARSTASACGGAAHRSARAADG
jgi:hypothetical protein